MIQNRIPSEKNNEQYNLLHRYNNFSQTVYDHGVSPRIHVSER
jgi:hypothetical protein